MYFLLVAGFPAADNVTLLDLWVLAKLVQLRYKGVKWALLCVIRLLESFRIYIF